MTRSFSITVVMSSLNRAMAQKATNRAMTQKAAVTSLNYNVTTTYRSYSIVFHNRNSNYRSNIGYSFRQLSARLNPVTSREGEDLNTGLDHTSTDPERQRALQILKFSRRYRLLINRIVNYL